MLTLYSKDMQANEDELSDFKYYSSSTSVLKVYVFDEKKNVLL